MNEFSLFFGLGLDHILDRYAYDHLLFVVALCVTYAPNEWRKVVMLVTAFSVGHSLSLALATLRFIKFDEEIIELLIPITILLTALSTLLAREGSLSTHKIGRNYFFAAFFGLIHGMGFSYYLSALLESEASLILPLFAFNVGIEAAQILIVFLFMLLSFLVVTWMGVSKRNWKIVVSSAIVAITLVLLANMLYLK